MIFAKGYGHFTILNYEDLHVSYNYQKPLRKEGVGVLALRTRISSGV